MRSLGYVAPGLLSTSSSNIAGRLRLKRLVESSFVLLLVCLVIIGVLGYVDYVTGYEQTFLLFYLMPTALGTWFGNFALGFSCAVLSVVAWVTSDVVAGVPSVGLWNIG